MGHGIMDYSLLVGVGTCGRAALVAHKEDARTIAESLELSRNMRKIKLKRLAASARGGFALPNDATQEPWTPPLQAWRGELGGVCATSSRTNERPSVAFMRPATTTIRWGSNSSNAFDSESASSSTLVGGGGGGVSFRGERRGSNGAVLAPIVNEGDEDNGGEGKAGGKAGGKVGHDNSNEDLNETMVHTHMVSHWEDDDNLEWYTFGIKDILQVKRNGGAEIFKYYLDPGGSSPRA